MEEGIVKAIALGAARSAVMAIGGWLASKGLSGDAVTGFEGSMIFLAGFAFQVYDVFVVKQKVAVAAATGKTAQ